MSRDQAVTVTIPAELRGWVLDGLATMMDGLRDEVTNMEETPGEYDWAEVKAAETQLDKLSDLYGKVAGR